MVVVVLGVVRMRRVVVVVTVVVDVVVVGRGLVVVRTKPMAVKRLMWNSF